MNERSTGELRWRCRRGMRELDLVLRGWFDARYAGATEAERGAFAVLLEQPDPHIAAWLLGRAVPEDPGLRALIDELCLPGASRVVDFHGNLRPRNPSNADEGENKE